MRLDEKWIRAHLPPDCADESIDVFSGYYLDGLTVMSEGERGEPDTAVYRAKSEDELRYWQLENICLFVKFGIRQINAGNEIFHLLLPFYSSGFYPLKLCYILIILYSNL